MSGPLFPSLAPKVTDPLWFTVDKPCDDEELQSKLEADYQKWLYNIASKDTHAIPIGKTLEVEFIKLSADAARNGIHSKLNNIFNQMDEDEDEDEDDEGEDDEESDTNDDELDTDMMDDRDSGDDASTY